MSNGNEKTRGSGMSILGTIEFNDSGDVPGVTQLLTPSLAKGRKKDEPSAPAPTPEPASSVELSSVELPPVTSSAPWETLAREIGVRLELTFLSSGGAYVFSRYLEHSGGSGESWRDEFYTGMRVESAQVPLSSDFAEFMAKKHPFLQDAFGAGNDDHLVFFKTGTELKVLLSPRSLLEHQTKIEAALRAHLEAREKPASSVKQDYDPGDDEGIKIEIAS
jgi:hypothetical protein